jgi:hypothetical protein
MPTLKTINVTFTGSNGNEVPVFDDMVIGEEGEHRNTKLSLTLPDAWEALKDLDPLVKLYLNYLNIKGRGGILAGIDIVTDGVYEFEIPKDMLYAAETVIWFSLKQVIDSEETRIAKSQIIRATVNVGYDVGTATAPFGNDIIQQLLARIEASEDAIDLRELLANKVDAFTETPDDTNYPTEKLVYDNLALKLNKDFTAFTAETTVADTDILPMNKADKTLKKLSWTLIKSTLKTYFDSLYPAKNTAITGATKTKITYDAKGLVTSGADATTADISDSTDKRYVTDNDLLEIAKVEDKLDIAEMPIRVWKSTTPYLTGAMVYRRFIAGAYEVMEFWYALQNSTNKDPSTESTYWQPYLAGRALSDGAGNIITTKYVAKETGKSLMSDTAITDLTDGGDTILHTHDSKVNVSAIVNDLTTGGTTVPLSAEMGKTLQTSKLAKDFTGETAETIIVDTDQFPMNKTNGTIKKTAWTLIKSTLKTAHDLLYIPKLFNDLDSLTASELSGSAILPVNKSGLLNKISFNTLSSYLMEYSTHVSLATIAQTIKGAINELVTTVGNKLAKTTNITSIDDTGIADGEIMVANLTGKKIETSNVLIGDLATTVNLAKKTGKIYEYVVATSMTSHTITGLDVLADGGYEIEIKIPYNATPYSFGLNYFVNADTTTTNYYVATNTNSARISQQADKNQIIFNHDLYMRATSTNPVIMGRSWTWVDPNTMGMVSTERWRYSPASLPTNITSLTINNSYATDIPVGTVITLYKKGVL